MKERRFFDKYYERLRSEALIRSVILGMSVGCTVISVLMLTFWMLAVSGTVIGILAGVLAGALSGILSYFLKYRPTDRSVARRIDRHGLEERMITMLELKDDTSYIASLQRADAEQSLEGLGKDRIGYKFSLGMLIFTSFAFALSLVFSLVCILAESGIIPYGKDLLLGGAVRREATVTYIAGEGGSVRGEDKQTVKTGNDGTPVRAIADEGWIFIGWDDGNNSPERFEKTVLEDITVKALFEKIDGSDSGEDESDSANDTPSASSNQENGSGSSDEEGGDNPENGGEGQGGGKWQDKNQFIDGATYYRDYLELYYQYAMGIFDSETDIPDDIKEFFETYFSGI
ncbi:MAG: hypothetical protein E7617_00980 [Ruminococcaceae bacterium]|nr:hypothetical protein [Oscillospiraceae bacterium]